MKKIMMLLFATVLVVVSQAQVKSGDAELDKRLAAYMQANMEKDFETIMDYMHPKLFKIAPREAIVSSMKAAFESGEMEIEMMDMGVTKAEITSFRSGGSEYRKITYKMTTSIKFTDTTVYEPEFIEQMTEMYTKSFEGKKVVFDKKTKAFVVSGTDVLYAIRDAGEPWLFLGFKNDPDLIKKLFPKEVVDHYKMFE